MLAPTFTDFFMIWFEKKFMHIIEEYGVKVWWRYVDDIFVLFKEKDKALELLEKLNSLHPNIKFTYEPSINKSENISELPFLDVMVTSDLDGFQTSVYRKKTFTGTYLNWNSATSRDYKIGLIKCLVNRAYKISSNKEALQSEIKKISQILRKNEYPLKIVSNTIQKQIKKMDESLNKEKVEIETVPKKLIYLVLPYFEGAEEIKNKLVHLIESSFPCVNLKLMFKSHNTIQNFFTYKDKIDQDLKSKIIYSVKCLNCEKAYIGKTIRHFCTRKEEHRTDKESSVFKHIQETDHEMDWDEMKILDSARDDYRLRLKEMMYINKLKPQLNVQKSSQMFSLLLNGGKDS